MDKQRVAQLLTYAGVLPLLAATIASLIQLEFSGLDYHRIILSYGAVIASFIAGIHWGLYLLKDASMNLFVHSNVAVLLAWLAAVTGLWISVFILIFCFVYLLGIDKRLYSEGLIEGWYLRMRTVVSCIVILLLAVYSLI